MVHESSVTENHACWKYTCQANSSYIPKLQTDAKSYSKNQEDQETGACEGFLLTVYHLYLLRGKLFGQS